ncbi:hypothetical protein EV188_102844 [Actinomycetospora succinea]|uniref:Protein kinase domain-containing protein n=1 Tax=Actinomycetospora succinea TaxID=663603 RepID=A0A4R6VIU7_9PSEU|nr:hypothetical protein [Actinomycetospora succinea]TDQ63187.1 hypothetical protein EV188_102844 [Actinomycetospora succinea]
MATDRYRLLERLGGTASRVYRARDVLLQRDVVVKSFPGDDGPERWERDALLRDRLGPGRAMEVLDGGPDGAEGPFVVMPLARDGSLADARRPHDPAYASVIVARLAAGLGCLHRRGVAHGAVAADAVLLDPALGPRWTGDGAPDRADASPEDDVTALAQLAVLAATGPLPVVPAPSPVVVDAVRALVLDAGDTGARERLRAGLAAHSLRGRIRAKRLDSRRVSTGRGRPRRSRLTVLAACLGAVLLGGAFGAGAGVGGGASAAVVAGTIGQPVVFDPAPARAPLVVLPADPAPAEVAPAPAESRAGGGGSSASGPRATSAVRSESRSGARSEPRSERSAPDTESDASATDDEADADDSADPDSAADSATDSDSDDTGSESSGQPDDDSSDHDGAEKKDVKRGLVGGLLDVVL